MDDSITRTIELRRPPEAVWRAVTTADQLSAWFGAAVDIDARHGRMATFRWPDGRERSAVVEVAEPEHLLVLRWLPFERGPDGSTRAATAGQVRFVLRPTATGTRLIVTESRPRIDDPSSEFEKRLEMLASP
jgi:uncharacterized protein YndB with AHSA1/START domain